LSFRELARHGLFLVFQHEQKTQNWWSSTNGKEQYTTLKNGRYVSGPTREVSSHLNFQNQSHSNNVIMQLILNIYSLFR